MTNKKQKKKMSEDMEMRGFSHYIKYIYYHKSKGITEYFRKPIK